MKILLIPFLLGSVLTLPCCTTDPATGNKLFLGKGKGEWLTIGLNSGKRAVPIVKEEYDKTSSK